MIQSAQHPPVAGWLVLVSLLIVPLNTYAKQSDGGRPHYPPLFALQLHTDFPKPRETFQELLNLVRDNYYSDVITEETLYYAAMEGILRSVSPPQLQNRRNLWSPGDFKLIIESLTGVQSSVGIKSNFNPVDGALTVREVLPGSPAQALLQPFDRIMRINGQPLKGKSVAQINALLRGKPGDTVRFKVVRDIDLLDVDIQLQVFKTSPLSTDILPGNIAYIALHKISKGSAASIARQLAVIQSQGSRALILDLRGNGGGIFAEALKTAELFLPARKNVVHTLKRGSEIKSYVSGNTQPVNLKLVVVVDNKTASAAELLTAALQANQRAQVVGTKTFGKATLEQTFALENGYRARFIIGALYGPAGKSWYGTGVRPDIVVSNTDLPTTAVNARPVHKRLARDPQLSAAWQLLR